MPSPIVHVTAGYLIYRLARPRSPGRAGAPVGPLPRLLLAAVAISVLPDLDAVLGILAGDLMTFHNNVTHSLVFGLAVSLGIATIAWFRQRSGFASWLIFALLCYELHIAMDFFTVGRGVMILWPISELRYEPPFKLFYGLHWSDGLVSVRHLWTLFTDLGFAALMVGIAHVVTKARAAVR